MWAFSTKHLQSREVGEYFLSTRNLNKSVWQSAVCLPTISCLFTIEDVTFILLLFIPFKKNCDTNIAYLSKAQSHFTSTLVIFHEISSTTVQNLCSTPQNKADLFKLAHFLVT